MTAAELAASLERIGQVQPHLSSAVAVLLAVVAIGAALTPGVWLVTRHITVIAHEGAHATMGSALGRKVQGISIGLNADGATSVSGGGRAGNLTIAAVGYLGPSGFGVGAALLISIGHVVAVLWVGLAALFCLMFVLRGSFGVVTIIAGFVALLLIAGAAPVGVQVLTAYALTWFLLVSGVRIVLIRGTAALDAGILRDLTRIPRGFWYRFWLLGTVAALAFGAILLV